MAHSQSIGAGMYTILSMANPALLPSIEEIELSGTRQDDLDAMFATEVANVGGAAADGNFVRLRNIREFPGLGTPPNLINVPVFGQPTSVQVQGQADPISFELGVNFVGSELDEATIIGGAVGDGKLKLFRVVILQAKPSGVGATQYASTSAGVGTVGNSIYYFFGKLEATTVQPNLTDADQSTYTVSIQSQFFGLYTVD